ncbi:hypothetical protein PI126_g4013 [Phytophthora idaei]|nr:hypothetical protein PI126_g4013 [Phytophthora idaei]
MKGCPLLPCCPKVPLVARTALADPALVLALLAPVPDVVDAVVWAVMLLAMAVASTKVHMLLMCLQKLVRVVRGDDGVSVDRGTLGATWVDGIAIGNINGGDGVDINAASYGAGFASPVVPEASRRLSTLASRPSNSTQTSPRTPPILVQDLCVDKLVTFTPDK